MTTKDILLTEDLADEVGEFAHAFNREIEDTIDIRVEQVTRAARKLEELAARAEVA